MAGPISTTVVNIHETDEYDVLIDRSSPWGNPFEIGVDGTRDECLQKFRIYIRRRPDLIREARVALKGKRLGCHCKPEACHGDIWAEIVDAVWV